MVGRDAENKGETGSYAKHKLCTGSGAIGLGVTLNIREEPEVTLQGRV